MYNYMVDQIQNVKHYSQPQKVPDPFQGINIVFRQTIYDQDQTMYNYMADQLENFKLQMQPQAVPVSDLSLVKVTSQEIFVSADMDPDLYPVQEIAQVFSETSNHDPHTSRLRTQTRFFTPLSCDIGPEITNPTSSKIVASSDLAPDPSAGIDSKGVISQGFCGPFLLNISCHDFEKVDGRRKISSQLWVRMAGY